MAQIPVSPIFRNYRGAKADLQRKNVDHNRMAQRIADHLNMLIANNPNEIQVHIFASIAHDLNLTPDQVRSALPGGHNGITVRIREEDRLALGRYRSAI